MVTHNNSGMNLKFKTKKRKKIHNIELCLAFSFMKCVFFVGDFVAKRGGKDLICSHLLSPKQLNLDHHNSVILSGLKAFRLQETGSRVYALHTHTH